MFFLNVAETDTLTSTMTYNTYKINRRFDHTEKYLIDIKT